VVLDERFRALFRSGGGGDDETTWAVLVNSAASPSWSSPPVCAFLFEGSGEKAQMQCGSFGEIDHRKGIEL